VHQENEDKKNEESQSTEDILKVARQRFDLAVTAESSFRKEALDDLKFRIGEQWPTDILSSRNQDKKPCLTINKLPQYLRQVTNDQRQNRPSIKVNPVDDKADVETAKVYQGLIRRIEYQSNADVAYDTAFDGSVSKGIGYIRVVTDYADPSSFDQEIFIKRIRNSFCVYLDPNAQEPDGSDANWGFVFEDISLDDYKAQYKKSKLASMKDWKSLGDNVAGWATDSTVRVAEYFTKTFKEVELVLLSSGETFEIEELPEILPEGVTVVQTRKSIKPAIKWYKINAVEILEQADWAGRWIPIVPVLGDEIDIDGRLIREGLIRHAKDPQRMYNYWASSETETIALAPKAPFIGAAGQFEGFEDQWKSANVKNHAFLQYNPKSLNGTPLGPPTRNVFEPPIQAITQARMQSGEDLKSTTGMYDATLGMRSNENSGIAIQRRNAQSQTNNFHFVDNLSRSIRHLGRILIDLIPHVYDTARTVRVLGEDDSIDTVAINQIFQKNGQEVSHMLGHGKYDVTVSTGPSFATKRQEAVQSMLSLTQSYPKVAEVAGDLMVKNMDWPGAPEIAERLKKTLPPGLSEPDDKEKQPIPPQVQMQMTQMNQLIEQLTSQLNSVNDTLDNKVLELESKERIENRKIQAQIEIELAKLGSREATELLAYQVSEIEKRLELLKHSSPIEPEIESGEEFAGIDQQMQIPTGGESPGLPMGD
jgi:Phage P22-like portal protein